MLLKLKIKMVLSRFNIPGVSPIVFLSDKRYFCVSVKFLPQVSDDIKSSI